MFRQITPEPDKLTGLTACQRRVNLDIMGADHWRRHTFATQQPRRGLGYRLLVHLVEEERNRRIQDRGHIEQTRCTDPVIAAFIFHVLLGGDADLLRDNALGHPHFLPAAAQTSTDKHIHRIVRGR